MGKERGIKDKEFLDEWMSIEERKERYVLREKVEELKREYKEKGIKMKISIERNKVRIRES